MANLGTLYVIAAPSGAGKTSLVDALLRATNKIKVSISYTTRPQRPNEINGVNYHFVNQDEFKKMVAAKSFLEHAFVHGHYYGTSKLWVEKELHNDTDVILEIDWQGAQQVRKLYPQSQTIFILPPSYEILKSRLWDRNQDAPKVIEQRLAVASSEMAHFSEFDYLIVNSVFSEALADLQAIVRANRLKEKPQIQKYGELLSELVKN